MYFVSRNISALTAACAVKVAPMVVIERITGRQVISRIVFEMTDMLGRLSVLFVDRGEFGGTIVECSVGKHGGFKIPIPCIQFYFRKTRRFVVGIFFRNELQFPSVPFDPLQVARIVRNSAAIGFFFYGFDTPSGSDIPTGRIYDRMRGINVDDRSV